MFRILIVDDNSINRVLLSRTLQKQNYEVFVATDGAEGLAKATEIRPALIICDWMMPKIDGLEVCRRIKADSNLSSTFFILLTSRGSLEDRIRGLDTGADDFLSKPVEMNELTARVRAGLRLHQLTQDLQVQNQSFVKLAQDLQRQQQFLEDEMAEAADYVRSILPTPMTGSVTINRCFIPSRRLGGDCFDYFWLDPDFLVIYLLDVSGHGLGAALPSVSVLNLLRSEALDNVNFYQPHQVLKALNETFQMDDQNHKYFTIWYGVYNQASHQLLYASAGHPPAILLSPLSEGTEVKQLRTLGLPIGMMPDSYYDTQRCAITPSSRLYVFSDGVYEVMQTDGEMLGLDKFIDLLVHHQEMCTEDAHDGLDQLLQHIQG